MRHAVILAAACLLAAAPAFAQTRPKPAPKPPEKEAPAPPPPAETPAPYDRDLLRLSEIIGALSFLRELCGNPDASEWPARMKSLLDAEGTSQGRRDRLAGAYNRGYGGYAVTYRVCTPSAVEAATRYIAEGERLSVALAGRFGG
ncbi:TIGR02301 family protein [Methylobacterium sp. 17Sr1-1]|uniref:TIGR02301 family protein n=1 Tax=Methylobacterium sp. 17Sr1-1 TaxID=2202826 RepID=UPI000D6EDE5B|nr:TIGR02301 family protein [Methylobacterium sp. 17Sr1-1]AWN51661.1 TIGR02301 family protein [Methylobacterium sp. 17Sr1-1]